MIPFAVVLSAPLRSAPLYALTSAVLAPEQQLPAGGRRKSDDPCYDVAFINRRGPRSGDVTGAFICTAYKVSSN